MTTASAIALPEWSESIQLSRLDTGKEDKEVLVEFMSPYSWMVGRDFIEEWIAILTAAGIDRSFCRDVARNLRPAAPPVASERPGQWMMVRIMARANTQKLSAKAYLGLEIEKIRAFLEAKGWLWMLKGRPVARLADVCEEAGLADKFVLKMAWELREARGKKPAEIPDPEEQTTAFESLLAALTPVAKDDGTVEPPAVELAPVCFRTEGEDDGEEAEGDEEDHE